MSKKYGVSFLPVPLSRMNSINSMYMHRQQQLRNEEQSSESKRNCSHESETALLCRPSNADRTDIVTEMEGIPTKMEESHFRTWDELEEVPAVESTLHWYEGVKQAWPVVDLGLSSLEWGLSFLRDSLQVKRLAGKSC